MKPVFHLSIGFWLLFLSANALAQTGQSTESPGSCSSADGEIE